MQSDEPERGHYPFPIHAHPQPSVTLSKELAKTFGKPISSIASMTPLATSHLRVRFTFGATCVEYPIEADQTVSFTLLPAGRLADRVPQRLNLEAPGVCGQGHLPDCGRWLRVGKNIVANLHFFVPDHTLRADGGPANLAFGTSP